MKKLILLISLITISVLFSGCCHFWFWPFPPPAGGPGPGPGMVQPVGPIRKLLLLITKLRVYS